MQIQVELVNIDTLKFHAALIVIPLRDDRQDAGNGRGGTRFAARVAVARPVFAVLVMTGLSGHRDTGIVDLNENGLDPARLGAWVERVVP